MKISKKCQYALKAIFELAWRNQSEPTRAQRIAEAQRISPRFMEIILNELKHGGFVESRRGNDGGYMLAQDAFHRQNIIRFLSTPGSILSQGQNRHYHHRTTPGRRIVVDTRQNPDWGNGKSRYG